MWEKGLFVQPADFRGTTLVVFGLILLFVLAGCGGVPHPPAAPNAIAPTAAIVTPAQGTPHIVASPLALDFGQVQLGSSSTQTLVVSNSGSADATVTSASVNGTGFSIAAVTFPLVLSAGRSTTLQFSFAPSSSGSSTGTVVLAGASQSWASVSLNGAGIATTSSTTPAHKVGLAWSPSPSLVDGYVVYRSTQTGGPYARLNSFPVGITSFIDTTVLGGHTYFYVVTAVSGSVESSYTNETVAAIPAP